MPNTCSILQRSIDTVSSLISGDEMCEPDKMWTFNIRGDIQFWLTNMGD